MCGAVSRGPAYRSCLPSRATTVPGNHPNPSGTACLRQACETTTRAGEHANSEVREAKREGGGVRTLVRRPITG
jgi:hypothetical protein